MGSNELKDNLVQTSYAVVALLNQVATEHDMSLTQLRVLAILRDHEPTMAQLASHLGLERSSVSGLVDRAVGRGLVRRDTSADDRRAVRVSLTPEGRRLAELGATEVDALITPLLERLGPADQGRLSTLLQAVMK
jgi:MarR family transcriptional regulator, lower aerobic nicotinate degradation pathway regulator